MTHVNRVRSGRRTSLQTRPAIVRGETTRSRGHPRTKTVVRSRVMARRTEPRSHDVLQTRFLGTTPRPQRMPVLKSMTAPRRDIFESIAAGAFPGRAYPVCVSTGCYGATGRYGDRRFSPPPGPREGTETIDRQTVANVDYNFGGRAADMTTKLIVVCAYFFISLFFFSELSFKG